MRSDPSSLARGAHGAALATLFGAVLACGSAAADDAAPPPPLWPRVHASAPNAPGLPELQRRATDDHWTLACVPPCTLALDPRGVYRFAGTGLVESDPFHVPLARDVRVEAKMQPTMLRDIGTAFVLGGTVFAVGGGAVLLLPSSSHQDQGAQLAIGATFLGLGIVTGALGVLLHVLSDTHVTVTPADAQSAQGS